MPYQMFLQEREHLFSEYSQAVASYQKTVLELDKARADGIPGHILQLLGKADTAKHTLNYCRDRYQNYCALEN